MTSRTRGWIFTVNNYSEQDEHFIFNLSNESTFVVCGREVAPTTGTRHLQGFVYFANKKTFSGVRDLLPEGAHVEPKSQHSSFRQCREYCTKDGDFYESGDLPMDPDRKGDAGKLSSAERWERAVRGDFFELAPEHYARYRSIHMQFRAVDDRVNLDNDWICGHSGCGKSRFVRDTYETFYSKGMNKWWDGYDGEDVVLLDDFAPEHAKYLTYYLKIWADHYAFNAEVKGGMLKIRPKRIVVTSQYDINTCFASCDPEDLEALTRRFNVIVMGRLRIPSQFAENFNHP